MSRSHEIYPAEVIKKTYDEITTYIENALSFSNQKDYASACNCFSSAIKLLESINDPTQSSVVVGSILQDFQRNNHRAYRFPGLTTSPTSRNELLAFLYAKRGLVNETLAYKGTQGYSYDHAIKDFEEAIMYSPSEAYPFLNAHIALLNWKKNQKLSDLEQAISLFKRVIFQTPSNFVLNVISYEELLKLDFKSPESECFFDLGLTISTLSATSLTEKAKFSRCLLLRANYYLTCQPLNLEKALSDYRIAFDINRNVFKDNHELLGQTGHFFNHLLTQLSNSSSIPAAESVYSKLIPLLERNNEWERYNDSSLNIINYDELTKLNAVANCLVHNLYNKLALAPTSQSPQLKKYIKENELTPIEAEFLNYIKSGLPDNFTKAIDILENASTDIRISIITVRLLNELPSDLVKRYASSYLQAKNKDQMLGSLYANRGKNQVNLQCYENAVEDFKKAIAHDPCAEDKAFSLGYISFMKWKESKNLDHLKDAMSSFKAALEISSSLYSLSIISYEELEKLDFGSPESECFFDLGLRMTSLNKNNIKQNIKFSRCLLMRANAYLTCQPIKLEEAMSDYLSAYEINRDVFNYNKDLLAPTGHVFNHILTHLAKSGSVPGSHVTDQLLTLLQLDNAFNIINYDELLNLDINSEASRLAFDLCTKVNHPQQLVHFNRVLIKHSQEVMKQWKEGNSPDQNNKILENIIIDCRRADKVNLTLSMINLFATHAKFYKFCDEILSNNNPISEEWKFIFEVVARSKGGKYFIKQCDKQCKRFISDETKEENAFSIIRALEFLNEAARNGIDLNQKSYYLHQIIKSVGQSEIDPTTPQGKQIYTLIEIIDKKAALVFRYQTYLNNWKNTGDINSLINALTAYNTILLTNFNFSTQERTAQNAEILLALYSCKETKVLDQSANLISDLLKKIDPNMLLNTIKQLPSNEFAKFLKVCFDFESPVGKTYRSEIFKLNELHKIDDILKKFTPDTITHLLDQGKEFWGQAIYFKLLIFSASIKESKIVFNPILVNERKTLVIESKRIIELFFSDYTEKSQLAEIHDFLDRLDKKLISDSILNLSPKRSAQLLKQCSNPKSILRESDKIQIIDLIFKDKKKFAAVLNVIDVTDICNCLTLLPEKQQKQMILQCQDSNTQLGNWFMYTIPNKVFDQLENIIVALTKQQQAPETLEGFQDIVMGLRNTTISQIKSFITRATLHNIKIPALENWLKNVGEKLEKIEADIEKQIQSQDEINETNILLTEEITSTNWQKAFAIVCEKKDANYFFEYSQIFLEGYENSPEVDENGKVVKDKETGRIVRKITNLIKALFFFEKALEKGIQTTKIKNPFYILDEIISYVGTKILPNSENGQCFFSSLQKIDREKALKIRCQTFLQTFLIDFEKNKEANSDSLIGALEDFIRLWSFDDKNTRVWSNQINLLPTLLMHIEVLNKIRPDLIIEFLSKVDKDIIFNAICELPVATINQLRILSASQNENVFLKKQWFGDYYLSFIILSHSNDVNIDQDYNGDLKKIDLNDIYMSIKKLPLEHQIKLFKQIQENPMGSALGDRFLFFVRNNAEEMEAKRINLEIKEFLKKNYKGHIQQSNVSVHYSNAKPKELPYSLDVEPIIRMQPSTQEKTSSAKPKPINFLDRTASSISNMFFSKNEKKKNDSSEKPDTALQEIKSPPRSPRKKD